MMLLLVMLAGCADTTHLEAKILTLEEEQTHLQREVARLKHKVDAQNDHLVIIHGDYADLAEAVKTLEVCE